MKNSILCTTAAMLLASGASFAQPVDQPGHKSPRPGTNTEAVSKVQDATAGVVGSISATMTSTTNGFVEAAAISDMYEVAASKLALQRSSSPTVKEFAQKMVDAHTETTTKLKGIISRIEWINPHAWIHVDVKKKDGTIENWAIETGTPNTLLRRGLRKQDLPVGTEIKVAGYQGRDGTAKANGVNVTLPDGRALFIGSVGNGAPPEQK